MFHFSNLLDGSWMMPGSNLSLGGGLLLLVVLVWSIAWKGLALWKAARTGSKPWFIVFLIVNTLGILEILYIFLFSKDRVGEDHHNERHSK